MSPDVLFSDNLKIALYTQLNDIPFYTFVCLILLNIKTLLYYTIYLESYMVSRYIFYLN